MNLTPRLSQLVATVLCALALIFSTTHASAQDSPVIGTLTFARGCTVLVNGQKQASGYQVHAGDVIKTSARCKAQVRLTDGGSLVINAGTRVRIYLEGGSLVSAVLIGGVNYVPSTTPGPNDVPVIVENSGTGADPLPFLGAFGFGNFSFPSIGGGSAANNRLPITNASGVVIGFAITDGSGRIVAFTDVQGNVLAVGAPNGTPVSSIFGPGAII